MYKVFDKKAQIPCVFFCLQKIPTNHIIDIFDDVSQKYVPFRQLRVDLPIPMKHPRLIAKFLSLANVYGSLSKYLIVTPNTSRNIRFQKTKSSKFLYQNLSSCVLKKGVPIVNYEWSCVPGPFHCPGLCKLVLLHGVHGFPYYDKMGEMGISKRGKFVFIADANLLDAIQQLLNSKIIMYLYSCTQYRMRFLDKHIYDFIPDISKLPQFDTSKITDEYICKYFDIDEIDMKNINDTKLWKHST
jgi:hypothetical protein